MDLTAIAGMLFVLIVIAMVAGFILMWPITRRLGAVLEQRLNGGPATAEISPPDIQRIMASLQALQAEMELLSERQEFTESLLSERQSLLLPKDKSSS